jgi:eukaryotic-like serine/threonine-protein kinase
MIFEHDATAPEKITTVTTLAFDQAPNFRDDSSATIETPSFLEDVHECERLLEAVWPGSAPPVSMGPKKFGKFSIVRELGRGGFGIVFLAEDRDLRRQVALKLPRPEILVTPDFRRRFLREAEAASRLDHPHIVPVYEVGEEGPICYIASAYCDGLTLAEWLRGQTAPVPILVAARLVAILSTAVAHAQERSILHRDLKPGNILLQRSQASPSASEDACRILGFVPRICDFGLAKLLDQASQETCSGVPIGSASYMAPEQACGRLREHGPATDVYALGVILYELLTGRPPFGGETDLETLRLVSDQEPPAPRALRPGLPRDIETIMLKCLEKRPVRRYATATELTADLQRFLDGKPVHARPVPAWEHAHKWVKRRPVHATLAVVIVLAVSSVIGVLLGTGAWLRWHHEDKREAVSLAERDTQRHERSVLEARIEEVRALEREQFGQFAERSALNSQVKLLHETLESGNVGLAGTMLEAHRPAPGRAEPDGFAWHYVRQLFRPDTTRLGNAAIGSASVMKMAISPDGRVLAAGMSDGKVILWDLVKEVLQGVLTHGPGPESEVYRVVFSADGRYLATGNPPYSIKIWDMATRKEQAVLPTKTNGAQAHLRGVFALRFTDDASCLAVFAQGWHDDKFQVWFWSVPAPGGQPELKEILDQKQLPSFDTSGPMKDPSWPRAREATAPWLSYARKHLALLDDGVTLAIKDGADDATLFDHYHHTPVASISGPLKIPVIHQRPFTGLTGSEVQQLKRQALRVAGGVDKRSPISGRPFDVVQFSPDGRTVAIHLEGLHLGGLGVVLFDSASSRPLITNVPARWRVVDLVFTPDGKTLVMGGFDSQLHVWHLRPNALNGHEKEIWSLAFSPDSKSLASGADDSTIKLWDVAGGRERLTLNGHGSLVTSVAYSPDRALLASASFDKTIRLWDAATGEEKGILRGHTDRVRTLAFSPDARTLASAGNDRQIRLWDVVTRSELGAPLGGHKNHIYAVAFSPDTKTLFSSGTDKTIRVWDWSVGQCRSVWPTDDDIGSLAVSPDSQTLAAGDHLGRVTLWDAAREKARAPLKGHTGDVLGLAFSPDGLTLASAGRDETVRLWDPATAQELLILKGHQAPVHAVSFSADGTILASGSHDGAIKLWRAPRFPNPPAGTGH